MKRILVYSIRAETRRYLVALFKLSWMFPAVYVD
jgi:hypothetical protein